jgi:hypothetical protein
MKKGTKSTASGRLTEESGEALTSIDYKFKMGVKPIVSPTKRSMNCPSPRQV